MYVQKYKKDWKLDQTGFLLPTEMRPAPVGGGASREGGAYSGAGAAVLPRHADDSAHGAQSWPAVQAEDHQRILSPVWRSGEQIAIET